VGDDDERAGPAVEDDPRARSGCRCRGRWWVRRGGGRSARRAGRAGSAAGGARPPERSPTRACCRGPGKPSRLASWTHADLLCRRAVVVVTHRLRSASMTLASAERVEFADLLGDEADLDGDADLALRPESSGCCAVRHAQEGGLAGAVNSRRCPSRSPGASCQVTRSSSGVPPKRQRLAWCRSTTSLPRRARGEARISATLSRGGGSSAIRAVAASIRNFGLLVRAGAPRLQPRELLAQQVGAPLGGHGGRCARAPRAPGRMPRSPRRRPPLEPRRRLPRSSWSPRRGTSGRALTTTKPRSGRHPRAS
jgi:hypothetical protein